MRQIIVVTSKREKVEKAFAGPGFYVAWCPMRVEELIRIRDRSNVIFLCVFDDDPEELKRIGLYLRDLCIEEEKVLYLYGNRMGVEILKSRVPALYIRKSGFAIAEPLAALAEDLSLLDRDPDHPYGRRSILIMDDDVDYIAKLRLHLEADFQIYVCPFDLSEVGALILYADIILIGTSGRLTIAEFIDMLRIIARRRASSSLHVYYLARDDAEREQLNLGSVGGSIAFSKEMEIPRIARFLSRL